MSDQGHYSFKIIILFVQYQKIPNSHVHIMVFNVIWFPPLSHSDSHIIGPGQGPTHEMLQQNWTFCLVFGRTKFGKILCSK